MILHGDCLSLLPTLDAESVDAVVTDPPYGLGFMGKQWDTFTPERAAKRVVANRDRVSDNPNVRGRSRSPAASPSAITYDYTTRGLREYQAWTTRWATEVFRVLKPGGHLLVCGAPRSYHRMACGVEDAGFIVRDTLMWLFGQGFPKSLDVSKAIDKAAVATRDRIRGVRSGVVGDTYAQDAWSKEYKDSVLSPHPITDAAATWSGWGTALKPAWEPIVLARKPLRGTVAENVQRYGTGALNIDGCRVNGVADNWPERRAYSRFDPGSRIKGWTPCGQAPSGRWPANVVHDGSEEVMLGFPYAGSHGGQGGAGGIWGSVASAGGFGHGDTGSAARFFYCAKPSRQERDVGCDDLPPRTGGEATDREDDSAGTHSPRAGAGRTGGARNSHPTVKPLALMRWLVRLVTPPGGLVLDPFVGSGTTGMACAAEGLRFTGIEREAEYVAIAERRIRAIAPLFTGEATA